ncbi:MAG: ribonuclease E/G, partial [Fimbriimonadaceae bacterium]|nr:ribonuclease E/G [Alphaproteobacteria bacterium]
MANKMLIDATHSEETRVVVVKGDRVEEFDFESATRKQLRGNIYLAKVTRVEPSLQAAFVDYGGNRHGFLAFSEIHPDYYQIPVADREALAEQEAEDERIDAAEESAALDLEADAEDEKPAQKKRGRRRKSTSKSADQAKDDAVASEKIAVESSEDGPPTATDDEAAADSDDVTAKASDGRPDAGQENNADDAGSAAVQEVNEEDESVDSIGAEDALEEVPTRPRKRARRYKIQEVIKRNQVLLVQVVKEERGNKGAALTTYMSIAGRYCVLMPNTARGGGISRKITNTADRKRLRAIAGELELPVGMGVILRTAGASRTKAEIKRDFEYLLRLWETVRDMTLESVAPTLVYEEGSLVKRSIRDLYSKEIDEILVGGEEAHKEAKSFMRMLMPTHAKNVKLYTDSQPIFARFNVENQLSAMFSPQVRLKSGGYIVINQTEALVAIDVNSGKATREHNIEATALATNLEAASEVARQFRLRDLAGLIVIDFIDMEENRNNRAVERKLKECLKTDRARIQVGRISHFGLLEMSRQRLRSGMLEGSTDTCPHCEGTGIIRSTESVALHILRMIEEALMKGNPCDLKVSTNTAAALYILNSKRSHLQDIEAQFGVNITIEADPALIGIDNVIERLGSQTGTAQRSPRASNGEDDRADTNGRRRSRRGGRGRSASKDETDEAVAADSAEDKS